MRNIFKKLAYQLLGWVAQRVLLKYHPQVVAVSGSQGKTSTVEAIYLALAPSFPSVRRSFGNYNTEWGVPASIIGEKFLGSQVEGLLKISPWGYLRVLGRGLALLGRKKDPDFPSILVLEMALNQPGDVAYLVKIAPPDIAVITNVSESHLGFFGSQEHLIQEKGKLIEGLKKDGGRAMLNSDDPSTPRFREQAEKRGGQVITFGQSEADWQIGEIRQESESLHFQLKRKEKLFAVKLPLLGRQFAWAAAAALAVGEALGGDLEKARVNLSQLKLAKHRMDKLTLGPYLVIDDTYNASYDSFREALFALNQIAGFRRRVAVIGGIHELGEFAPEAHRRLGILLAGQVDFLVITGPEAFWTKEGALSSGFPEAKIRVLGGGEEKQALNFLQEGDIILFKASRTRELDKLVEELKKRVSQE